MNKFKKQWVEKNSLRKSSFDYKGYTIDEVNSPEGKYEVLIEAHPYYGDTIPELVVLIDYHNAR